MIILKNHLLRNILFTFLSLLCLNAATNDKPRVFVLTDIENEPDDAMSMVRFQVYDNQYDVEGLERWQPG